MNTTCIIVEDEPIARDILRSYISEVSALELVKEFEDGLTALTFLRENEIDLLFLDINMPKLSGIDLVKSLPNPPSVILTTAYSEFALESYELDVVDYLLKPFSFERFLKAVKKVSGSDKTASKYPLEITIKADRRTYRISTSDIQYISALGDYITVHTPKQKFTFYSTLKTFLSSLDPSKFVRVHKSYVVQLHHISFVEGNVITIQEIEIPIGKAHKANFEQYFLK